MKKILNSFIALGMAGAFFIFSVLCCCTASAVVAQIHKAPACSHCPDQNTGGQPSKSSTTCQRQFISAEFTHGSIFSASDCAKSLITFFNYFDHYKNPVIPALALTYPPGGPPLGISFTPLYLRTFNLRI